jgi:hypothetical protein
VCKSFFNVVDVSFYKFQCLHFCIYDDNSLRTDAPIFFSRQPAPCKKSYFSKNYLTTNICQNYLTLNIILKLLPASFICRIAIQSPSIIKKVLFSPKNCIFHPWPRIDRTIFFPLIYKIFTITNVHSVLINFRISSPFFKQSKQPMPKSACFQHFCTVKRECVVPAIIFSSVSLRRFMLQNATATPSELKKRTSSSFQTS